MPSFLSIPNFFTFLRIIAAHFYLYYGLKGDWHIAFVLFVASAVTDFVDGGLARILKQRTRLGAFLDPVADKLLMFYGVITLTYHHFIPLYLAGIIFMRDLYISLGLWFLKSKKAPIVYRPTYLSKVTTVAQIITLATALVFTQGVERVRATFVGHMLSENFDFLCIVTAILTFLTTLQYTRVGLDLLRRSKL